MDYNYERPMYSPGKKPIIHKTKSFNSLYMEEKDKILVYMNPIVSVFLGITVTFITALLLKQIFD
jgi:hypothetical protein